jgi:hypothetical protein
MGLCSIPTGEIGQQITKVVSVRVRIAWRMLMVAFQWPCAPAWETQDRSIPHVKIEHSRPRHLGRSADTSAGRFNESAATGPKVVGAANIFTLLCGKSLKPKPDPSMYPIVQK